jgi:hypothetical protein
MVFGRRSKAPTNELNNWSEILDVYWEFLEALDIGTKVYLPLWDKEGLVEEVCQDFILVSGLLPDPEDDWVPFLQHWELEKR